MVAPLNRTTKSSNDDTCPAKESLVVSPRYLNASAVKASTYNWDEETQGLILSSFYWGYVLTNIFAGFTLDKLGGKHTLGFGVLSTAALTILTPLCIKWGGATAFIGLRLLMGLCEGAMYPAILRLMAQWTPEDERSWAASWAFSGSPVGTIIGMAASGAMIQRSDIGWPIVFYFYGGLGVLIYLLHCVFCYDSPAVHPFVSKSETNYLSGKLQHTHTNLPPTPWLHMIRSKSVWALLTVTTGKAWCLFTYISDMPKFMSSVLKLSVEENGYISSIPHVVSWIAGCALSWLADYVIAKKLASTTFVRKIGSSIALVGTGVFLVIATYVGCNATLVVTFHTIGMIMFSCNNFGIMVNALDLAPNYVGALQGVVFGFATAAGFLAPYAVGVIAPNQTISEWKLVFWLMLFIGSASNAIFVVCGSAEVRKWNNPSFLERKKLQSEKGEIAENDELLVIK
ncbi:sialin-like [Phymastichus coffea]|uniref:sialin-like n=1 Tax=Phymastichus coffea TaxID=108790 RepID=UPI00273C5A80|nr:sialin-like [Phymastichus coffea]